MRFHRKLHCGCVEFRAVLVGEADSLSAVLAALRRHTAAAAYLHEVTVTQ